MRSRAPGGAIKADLLGRLNRLATLEYPDDARLRARIRSYELAFRNADVGPGPPPLRRRGRVDAVASGFPRGP